MMSTQIEATARPAPMLFTPPQWQALKDLRTRYHATGDDLSQAELERLQFMRWLYRTGRLQP
jgi:hypothetical protein